MRPITTADLFRQLKNDLTGKDSYRGVTLSYAWLANQFGHFSLGFIPTILGYRIIPWLFPGTINPAFVAALVVSLGWLLFEMINLLWPLLGNKPEYRFKPDWKNLVFDTSTDVLFFALGAFAAAALLDFRLYYIWILAGLGATLAYCSYYWYLTKLYQQAAGYPFQFRLSQWKFPIQPLSVRKVYEFLEGGRYDHLLLFGGRGTGKTSLAVGLANEYSIRKKCCEYTTAMKLFTRFFEPEVAADSSENQYWTWRSCEVLVIDDINPGDPIPGEVVSAEQFSNLLLNDEQGAENLAALRKTKVVWVLGDGHQQRLLEEPWRALLQKLGIPAERICSINLAGSTRILSNAGMKDAATIE